VALVQLHPDAGKRFFLRAGRYGPGMDHEAECEILDYQYPAEDRPGWDQQEKTDIGDFAFLKIRVRTDEGIETISNHVNIKPNSGSPLPGWLVALGVTVEDDETCQHDTDALIGLKCAVEVGDPRADKQKEGVFYTGYLNQVYGV